MFRMVGKEGVYVKNLKKVNDFSIMQASAGSTFTLKLGCASF